MKLLISLLMMSFAAYAGHHHLPLQMTFEESQAFYRSLDKTTIKKAKEPFITEAIDGGEKMSRWLALINDNRQDGAKLRLTSKATQRGIPIDRPSIYGPHIIKERLENLKDEMPQELKAVIYGVETITTSTIIGDEDYVKWCRKVSKLYQTAVRWTGSLPHLSYYSALKAKDVRGFYYLKNLKNLDLVLQNIAQQSPEEIELIKKSLHTICVNDGNSERSCKRRLARESDLLAFKNKYWKSAQRNWDSFFKITNPRTDVIWKKDAPHIMSVVFKDPKNEKVATWLKENIEDEFRFAPENWALEMNFTNSGWDTAYIQFRKNVTPHVAGGNRIVMDANTDLDEYNVRWTIRHEYGHILRIPDCYHEFYDKDNNVMINYQLDTSDLMCSRVGEMNKRIYEELKRVYLK